MHSARDTGDPRSSRGLIRLLEWPQVDRVLFVSAVCLAFVVFYAFAEAYYLSSPQVAPWANHEFVGFAYRMQIGFYLTGWLTILIAALWQRVRGGARAWLVAVVSQFYFGGFALAAVWFGQFTNMFGAVVLLAGVVFGLGLFKESRRAILQGVLTYIVIVVGAGLLERAGVLPYAPLFAQAPFEGGRLSSAWLATYGGVTFGMLLIVALINALIIGSWHDREAKLNRANRLIRRYIPSQLADELLSGESRESDVPERRKVTILFSDVEGFTATAEQLEPEDLARVLNEYLAEMAIIAEDRGGAVTDIAGDGMMIVFGATDRNDAANHAPQAVDTALAMQKRMTELYERWFREGMQSPFRIRIGINTGVATVGSFGSEGRKVYSAIGTQTNLAARIQQSCEPGSVLTSHTTWALAREEFAWRERGEIAAKGIHYPVKLYQANRLEGA